MKPTRSVILASNVKLNSSHQNPVFLVFLNCLISDLKLRIAESPQQYNSIEAKKRVPKRILHFSDGILEEYSTDEEEIEEKRKQEENEKQQQIADPTTMSWIPWVVYLAWMGATGTLSVCDAAGERLAWWLGITSPKYYYEIQEAKRMQKEEEERKSKQDGEMAGWVGERDGGLVRSQEEVRGKDIGVESPAPSH